MDKKIKTRVVTLEELIRLSERLGKVTRFNLTGALLCGMAMLYYLETGSQLLPKVLGVVMVIATLLAILSYRTGNKVAQVIEVVKSKRQTPNKPNIHS